MSKNRFVSVWDAIEGTHEEAENMKLRSALMIALKAHLAHTDLSQARPRSCSVSRSRAYPTSFVENSTCLVWMLSVQHGGSGGPARRR